MAGIIRLVLGVLILLAGLFFLITIIGLLLGILLIFIGIVLIASGVSARGDTARLQQQQQQTNLLLQQQIAMNAAIAARQPAYSSPLTLMPSPTAPQPTVTPAER